jgi:hypothetical protein
MDKFFYDYFNKKLDTKYKITGNQKTAIKDCKFVNGELYKSFKEEEIKKPTGNLKGGVTADNINIGNMDVIIIKLFIFNYIKILLSQKKLTKTLIKSLNLKVLKSKHLNITHQLIKELK